MDEFRLCVSVDGRVAHLPCSSFYSEAGTCSLSFDVLAPVVLPRPLLCTSSDDAVPFDTLAAIREARVPVHDIALAPLSLEEVGRLVADTLHCEAERAEPLLLCRKNAGIELVLA